MLPVREANIRNIQRINKIINYNKEHDKLGRFADDGVGVKILPAGSKDIYADKNYTPIFDYNSEQYLLLKNMSPYDTFHKGDTPAISKESTIKNIKKLNDKEVNALTGYTSEYGYGSYNEINKYFRGDNKQFSQETINAAKNIKSGLDKTKLGTSTYLYRGSGPELFADKKTQNAIISVDRMIRNGNPTKTGMNALSELSKLKGKTITDKAPLSTSPGTNEFFTNKELKITIKTKVNDKAMNITDISRYGGASLVPAFMGTQKTESEVLYAPNTNFKITDVQVTTSGVHLLMETTK